MEFTFLYVDVNFCGWMDRQTDTDITIPDGSKD